MKRKSLEEKALTKWWSAKVRNHEQVCAENICANCARTRLGFLEGYRAGKRGKKS